MQYQSHITLPNDVQATTELGMFVDEVCENVGFDMSTTFKLNLAIEEAVVNVMSYAYPAGTKGDVDIDAEADDEQLKFVISDSGTPFDPTQKGEVDTTLSAEERGIGGLGIHLIRQIMDTINYERVDGKNVLTLRKKLTKNL
ncbi:MAG: ATP-binding protein [Prevotella ruminicola]|jgi:sigma-B regulation protein RsbU (phosphoserine phosphatase)|uniref:ATP-binding protein n=1 Tax=Xylanibacter ruminicola TaxID=839 RepID=A0A928BUR2_XYLRU|nr:ATP-binding protein [Xylanibacter ruminicola]